MTADTLQAIVRQDCVDFKPAGLRGNLVGVYVAGVLRSAIPLDLFSAWFPGALKAVHLEVTPPW